MCNQLYLYTYYTVLIEFIISYVILRNAIWKCCRGFSWWQSTNSLLDTANLYTLDL